MPGFSVWMADRAPGKKKRNAHANYLPRPAGGERAGVRGDFSSSDRQIVGGGVSEHRLQPHANEGIVQRSLHWPHDRGDSSGLRRAVCGGGLW